MKTRTIDVLVIGAAQAGLTAGYYLKKTKREFLIVDAGNHIGDSWLARWDSLRLFTPRPYCSLPGLKLSKDTDYYPTKFQIAQYLTRYAEKYRLPIQLNCRVISLTRRNALFEAVTDNEIIIAKKIIIATGSYADAYIPDVSNKLDEKIKQLHSSQYKNPSQFIAPRVVVVGGGNSAAQIAVELAKSKQVAVVSRRTPQYTPTHLLGLSIFTYVAASGLFNISKKSKLRSNAERVGNYVIGTQLRDSIRHARIRHFNSKVIDATKQSLILQDGTNIPVEAVLWATGYKNNYKWIRIPGALSEDGLPLHHNGVSLVDGLYWVGLPWQRKLDSSLMHGVGKDARYVVGRIS